jgi:hypothetical protein
VLALRDDDASQWISTQDAAAVCSLAGVDRDAVMRAMRRRLLEAA